MNASELYAQGNKYYNAQDYKKAVEFYTKAAEQGNASAQYWLGFCDYFGRGVAKSRTEAAKW